MKSGLFMGVSIGFAVLIMVFAGTPVAAIGPGIVQGNVGAIDTYWLANPGWSVVWDHNDVNTGTWTTGLSYWDVWYRNGGANPPPAYAYYAKEFTFPWIGIQMAGGPMVRYEHADVIGNPVNHLIWNGVFNWQNNVFPGYFESPNQPIMFTQLEAWYDLDFDGDGVTEWTFAERIELHGQGGGVGGNPPNGFICMQTAIVDCPWADLNGNGIRDDSENFFHVMPNGQLMRVQTIEYGYLFDADVDNSANNNMFMWNNMLGWVQLNNEAGPLNAFVRNPTWQCAMTVNPVTGKDIMMEPIDWPPPSVYTANYYCLAYSGNEYSQHPLAYVNGQNIANTDNLFWYVEDWNPPGIWYPSVPGWNRGWNGVIFCDFT